MGLTTIDTGDIVFGNRRYSTAGYFFLLLTMAIMLLMAVVIIFVVPVCQALCDGCSYPQCSLNKMSCIMLPVYSTFWPQRHLVKNAQVSALPRTCAPNERNGLSRMRRICIRSVPSRLVSVGNTANFPMRLADHLKVFLLISASDLNRLSPKSLLAHWNNSEGADVEVAKTFLKNAKLSLENVQFF